MMENRDLVVPANSRIDETPTRGSSELKTSPPPPKSSPVSSASRLSLTSKLKGENKTVEFEEIRRGKSSCSSVEEEKQVADVLKGRLYDNAGTSDVYRSLRTQPRIKPRPPVNSSQKQQSALYRATLLRKEKQKKLPTQITAGTCRDHAELDAVVQSSSDLRRSSTHGTATLSPLPDTPGTTPGCGPDCYEGLDIVKVVQLLRKRLNWETNIETIIKEEWMSLKCSTQPGKAISKTLYTLPDDGVFAYATLKDLNNPIARYNPYDLVCVGAAQTFDSKQLFTVTASAVTQLNKNVDADLIPIARWLHEWKMFHEIFKMPVFANFRIWKAFTTWRNNVRSFAKTENRQTLRECLSTADDVLQVSVLKIRSLCEEQCSSLQHEPARILFIDEKFGEKTFTLDEFVTQSSLQADLVHKQLQSLRATCLSITADACQNVIERHAGLLQWMKPKSGTSDPKPTYIQIAQWRSVLTRLHKFVRGVDFVILELLRRLVVRAACTLLAKVQASSAKQYPAGQHDADDSITSHEPSCPPAMLTVKLVLSIPESVVMDDAPSVGGKVETLFSGGESGRNSKSTDRNSSELSQRIAPSSFVDLDPSKEEFISAMQGVISKFQEVVSSFKSLLADECIASLVTPPSTDLVHSLRQTELDDDTDELDGWPDVKLIFGKDPDYQHTVKSLIASIKKEIHGVRVFSEDYRGFCRMVDVCRRVDVDALMSDQSWGYNEFHSALLKHSDQLNAMKEMILAKRIGFLSVDVTSFFDSCIPYPTEVLQRVHHHLPIVAAKANNVLLNVIKGYSKNLDRSPASVENFMERLNLQARVSRELPQLEQEFLKVNKLYSLAISFDVHVEPEEMALYQTLMPSFHNLKSTMLYCEAKKDENIMKFSCELDALIGSIHGELVTLKNKIRAPSLIDSINTSKTILETLSVLGDELQEISSKARNYAVYQDHFVGALSSTSRRKAIYMSGSDDGRKADNAGSLQRDVVEVERDLSLRRLLWESSDQWKRLVNQWEEEPFDRLNVDEMQKTVSKLMQTIFLLEKGVPANNVIHKLKQEVTTFKQGMPAVISLRNHALRPRHWDAVQILMQRNFVRDKHFTLGVLLKMNVFRYKTKIVEISSHATNEFTLEQMLRKVMDFWNRTDFNLTAHASRDIAIINGADDITTALEDSLVTLANIKSSRFVAPIKPLVEEWDRKLTLFSLTLEEWLICQRHWLYLESIFSASDIQRQLPNETRLFTQVDRSWKDIMRRAADHPNALRSTTAAGVLEILQTCNTQMDKIHRCLEDYLETKRLIFPRFYFLSNDDLIDILSNGKDPQCIQPHLKKCFGNVRKLGIKHETNAFQVYHMISAEDECVALNKPVKIRGAIESWLATVENAIRNVIKLYLKQALSRRNEEFTPWVLGHPGQVVLTVSQILFCRDVVSCMENKERSFETLHEQQLSTLNSLVDLVMSPLLFHHRRSIEALLTIKVHERDVLRTLIDDDIHDAEDFQWKRQLRYKWSENESTCHVLQHNASFEYGYEYLGCPSRLVITPLTDRCYLTLTGALHLRMGGAPFGPAGTGKTETVKDLAKALGKQCVVFNCSEALDYKMTGRFFSGIAQSGSWFCFDEFNRIDVEVLSVIAQQLHALKTAKDNNATWFVFEGRDIRLCRTCGVCITMNPGYTGRVELPDNVKSLFRPFAMMVPDYVLITEIILFSEGFVTAMSLSRKIVKLYELISKQLSQQDHYDFGLRSIKSMLLLAGKHKRSNPRPGNDGRSIEEHEAGLLLKAIHSTNVPKFVTEDIRVFEQILNDLFPGLSKPHSNDKIFQKAMELALEELHLKHCPSQLEKVAYFHENLLSRGGIALVGETGGGKTTIKKILKEAMSLKPILNILEDKYMVALGTANAEFNCSVVDMTRKQIITSKYVIGKKAQVNVATINPKCVSMSELYGEFNSNTMEWKDGILSRVFRTFSNEGNTAVTCNKGFREKEESHKITIIDDDEISQAATPSSSLSNPSYVQDASAWYWIVLDGPVDTVWVENLNTVLDDTKVLCLSSGERINTGPGMKFIFEVDNLANASPATVSRCAMVYVDPRDLGWRPFVKAWFSKLKDEEKISEDGCDHLLWLFNITLDEGLAFRRSGLTTNQVNQTCDLSVVKCLCAILESLLNYVRKEERLIKVFPTDTPERSSSTDVSSSNVSSSNVSHSPFTTTPSSDYNNLLSKLYLFSFTWSIGCNFVASAEDKDYIYTPSASLFDLRQEHEEDNIQTHPDINSNPFDAFIRKIFQSNPILEKMLPPAQHSVFDCFLNLDTEQFVLWQTLVPKADVLIQKTLTRSIAITESLGLMEECTAFDDLKTQSLVPTRDTIRYEFLLALLLLNDKPVLLTGDVGVGKSILVEDVLLRLSKEVGSTSGAGTIIDTVLRSATNMNESLTDVSKYHAMITPSVKYSSMQCSARLTPKQVQAFIVSKLIKSRRHSLGAQEGAKVIVFMDDLNMPGPDEFGTQPPLELIREYLDHGGFYDTRKLLWTDVDDATVVAACGPPTGGRHSMSPRVVSHFNVLSLPRPAVKSLHRIFQVRLGRHLQSHDFLQDVREMYQELVFATLSVFFAVAATLLPTPAKSHYTFNLKDVNKVVLGLLQADSMAVTTRDQMTLLFAHEATRVFHDRLVEKEDRQFFYGVLMEKIDHCIRCKVPVDTLTKKTLIFGDFADLNNPKADRSYRQIKDVNLLSQTLQEFYNRLRLSDENFDQPFVFFRQAVEHLSRAARVFRQLGGHLLLVGLGGTGKGSVVKLAAYLENCEFRTLRTLSNYNITDFHEDVKAALCIAGIDGLNTVLFLNDRYLVKESFFEDVSYMLNGREVPDMFSNEDKERIFISLGKNARSLGISNDKHAVFDLFKQRVNDHIHYAVSMTPSGTLFRQRCRVYPSLINCCAIDWYDEWPNDALEAVGKTFLQSVEIAEFHRLTRLSVDVHHISQEAAGRFRTELSRRCYATPATYMECIQMFLEIFVKKREEYLKYRERLSAGILKLDESYELVGKMKQELVELSPELERKAKDTEVLLNQLAKDQESVDEVRHVVSEEESLLNQEAERVREIADEAQRDLDQAIPALMAANEDLNTLDKSDIAEIRVYTKPPGMVITVMAAVCLILEEKTDWANTKQVLADPGFLKRLINFNKDSVTDRVFGKLKRYTSHPNFTPDHVGKISVACKSMCRWVIALDYYTETFRAVLPKRARCEEAFQALVEAKHKLDLKQAALANIEHQLQLLRDQYQASLNELESLHERKRLTTERLGRASILSRAFSEEHQRWLESVRKLDESSQGLVGDAFLAAATIAYLGPFTQNFREQVYSLWFESCQKRDIPVSSDFDLAQFLTNPSETQRWLSHSLPHDTTSIQSAVLVANTRKWPLLIDPQQQAVKWISEMEKENGVTIVKSGDVNCLTAIEEAVQLGKAVVITDVRESIDPRLESVLQRRTTVRGNQHVMKINETEVEYNSNFKLFLATSLVNPQFFSEVFNQVTVINFTVTFEGLQDQLLSKVVYEERPELERKFFNLIENVVSDRSKIRDLEDKCLDLLHSSEGNILDDEELISTIEDSKNTANTIQRKVEQSEAARSEIRLTREHYLPVATRGAIIYFTLVDLPSLNIMYQFSLQWFVDLFVSCLLSLRDNARFEGKKRPDSPLLGTLQAGTVQPLYRINKRRRSTMYERLAQQRRRQLSLTSSTDLGLQDHLESLIDVITETVYRHVTYGLFAQHQTTFSFLLCCNIMKYSKDEHSGMPLIGKNEWSLFIWGTSSLAFTERNVASSNGPRKNGTPGVAKGSMGTQSARAKPPLKWISVPMWQECVQLSALSPSFSGLCQDIVDNLLFWSEFVKVDDPYIYLDVQDDPIDECEDKEKNAWSCSKLSSFNRLMVVKILRPERLLESVRTFVKEHLGSLFVSALPLDLREIFSASDPKVPLVFILAPGTDPASQLMRFVRDIRGSACQLDMVSLGRGQETRTEETVTKAYKHRGRWVFLQNCHLALSFMPKLKEIIRKIAEPGVAVEPSFRLWLSSAPHKDFPISILQAATKMTVESSPGIKANILQSFATVGGAVTAGIFEDNNPGPHWKKLLFGLCLLNAVVQERRKFGALGWNIPYDFPSADLEVSISMLRMLLSEHANVPWQALVYLTAEITYGGRVTDKWDKRCLMKIVEKFCSPDCLEDDFSYTSSQEYQPPSIGTSFSDCCDYIESLPTVDHPELFGMPSEANRFCLQNEAKRLLDDMILVHPQIDNVAGSGKSNDEIVLELVSDIQKLLPTRVDYFQQQPSTHDLGYPTTNSATDPVMNPTTTTSSALHTVLKREVARFTRLLNVIHASLNSLFHSIHGRVLLSDEIEETYKSLLVNQVPPQWQKVSYDSTKPLASWANNLVQRINFFSRWLEATLVARDTSASTRSAHSTRSGTVIAEKKSSSGVFRSPDMPRAFWISAFFFPLGFFTSVLQRHARVHHVPVDSLRLNYEITERTWLHGDEEHERDLDMSKIAFHGSSQDDCVRIFGLYLDGAVWEATSASLQEAGIDERFSALPELKILPVVNAEEETPDRTNLVSYECPVYSTPTRGNSFILAIHLPSRHPSHHWVTRGVALVTQLPE
ncbi:dynein heavy chain 6, axonemal-like isoform X2 [Dendronephthya gigantea]|uniref:dynein heavy chain 6, axonemal-like isoform X2 n=1 Tax=Dendronephthya gigantea TaxID=151771 RepID=UPI00106A4204|nr:dynein heavy chain 6, axonemal-like isoform X2 [Dendronephthya gigantea]